MSWRIVVTDEVANLLRQSKPKLEVDDLEALSELEENIQLARRITTGPHEGRLGYVFRVRAAAPLSIRYQAVIQLSQDETTAYVVALVRTDETPFDEEWREQETDEPEWPEHPGS